jgi:hypothetical protein
VLTEPINPEWSAPSGEGGPLVEVSATADGRTRSINCGQWGQEVSIGRTKTEEVARWILLQLVSVWLGYRIPAESISGAGNVTETFVPWLSDMISKWPFSWRIRSRIPLIPTPEPCD